MRKPCIVCGKEIDKSESAAVTLFICSEECKAKRKASMPKRKTKTSTAYWIQRGMTETEAKQKVSELQRERSPRCPEYWVKKGLTHERALVKVSEYQTKNSQNRMKKTTKEERRKNSPFCKEYWMSRGLTQEEAKQKLSENSSTISLKAFQDRLGAEQGRKEYRKMCENRREAYTLQGYIRRHGEKKGRELWHRKYQNRYDSKKARKFISRVLSELDLDSKVYWSGLETGEYGVRQGDRYYLYDLVIPGLRLAIEYHGDYWHCHPDKYADDFVHPHNGLTAKEIREKDLTKAQALKESRGFDVVVIWESDDEDQAIQSIKEKVNEFYQSQNQE